MLVQKKFMPRQGRQKMDERFYLSPLPGLGWFVVFDPRFHRGLLSAAPPALGIICQLTRAYFRLISASAT
jgi:hypothetical protein